MTKTGGRGPGGAIHYLIRVRNPLNANIFQRQWQCRWLLKAAPCDSGNHSLCNFRKLKDITYSKIISKTAKS